MIFRGNKLRDIRRAKSITLKGLAKKASVNWVQVQGYETGKREPMASTLRKIALALDVSMDEFFDNEYPGRPRPLKPVLEEIKELAERRRLNLPKDIYPLSLFQEALGIADNEVFTNILLVLAKGKIIELVPVFPCDIKQGMKVYQVPGLGKKKYYSFTISQ